MTSLRTQNIEHFKKQLSEEQKIVQSNHMDARKIFSHHSTASSLLFTFSFAIDCKAATIIMTRLVLLCLGAVSVNAFVQPQFAVIRSVPLYSSKKEGDVEVVSQQKAFPVGTFVEFEEKKRTHIGKIDAVEHKSSGGARYNVMDSEGKQHDIADKAVLYSMACPNSPGQADKLFQEFCQAQDAPTDTLQEELEITPELLEMAWEEAAEDEDHLVTASSLIELVQGHAASAMEKYLAWKLLKTEMAHIFFKEIKDHGRVVAFKAKTRKAVDAAKEAFCQSHADNEICLV
jgi:hypothetical protein